MKIKLLLGVLTTGAALTMVQAQAQMPDTDYLFPGNLLKNPGFELPNTIKIISGFASVPDWNYAPTPTATDSGIDPYWATGASGSWAAQSMATDADAGVWANQDTGYVLQSGDILFLSLVAGQNWTFDDEWNGLPGTLHYEIWTVQGGGPGDGAIYDGYFTVHNSDSDDGAFNYYSTLIPNSALEAYAGQTIGISIYNSSDTDGLAAGGQGSWIDFDDVFLCSSAGFYTYTTNYDNTIIITSYTGPFGGAAVIPCRINGLLVTTIGYMAFDGFLKDDVPASVTIPDSVTTIGGYAFTENVWLTDVTIGKGVTSIGADSFLWCFSLSSITVDPANPFLCSVNGILFDKSTNTIIKYPAAIQADSYTVPKSVTSIGDYAFWDCNSLGNSLTSVYFQGNAPSIGSYAFNYFPATVYYLPGTTGWDNFAQLTGVTTVLWNPQAQSDASFGVLANQFGFNIIGSSNLVIVVEACTNFTNPVWQPVQTKTLNTFVGTNGSSYFSDPAWTNYPGRFYRFRSP